MNAEITIVNFVTDDKFTDGVIDYNERFSPCNVVHLYVFVCDCPLEKFALIKNAAAITKLTTERVIPFLQEKHANAVLLHSLYSMPLHAIPEIPFGICVIWSSWGYDIYSMLGSFRLIDIELFSPFTKAFLKPYYASEGKGQADETYQNAVRRIDYLSTVLPEEYDLIPPLPYLHARKLHYTYITSKEVEAYQNASVPTNEGENLLVGNSGAPTNNHLDILEKLSELDIGERRIYCPLSYAGYPPEYKDEIIERGKHLFGDNFVPLLEFLDKETYFSMMSSCKYVFMGHLRQQALGNVREMLIKGSLVFLDNKSPMYKHFKERGFCVFSIQDDVTKDLLQIKADERAVRNNIEKMKQYTSPRRFYSEMLLIEEAIRKYRNKESFLTRLKRSVTDIICNFAHV